jgi:hypothetical protein
MPDKSLDPAEWKIVRENLAAEKERVRTNGDWARWEVFRAQVADGFDATHDNDRDASLTRAPTTEEQRQAWAVRSTELSFLSALRRNRWPFR